MWYSRYPPILNDNSIIENNICIKNYIYFDYLLKFILIGDSDSGKSEIILRFSYEKINVEYEVTIGVKFVVKNIEINNRIYRIQIWDTAG